MTYEQAIAICRNPARSVRDAKAVLRWAVSEPAPDKVWFLLLLASNAFTAHKGFQPEFDAAVLECARADASGLWDCVERDWESTRVFCALLLLLKLPDVSPARLLALGRKPMERSRWGHLVRWAERSGVAIPEEMAQQQEQWEAESDDGLGRGGWGELGSRRANWPSHKDLAKPPFDPANALAASLPPGYGASATSVTRDLEAIRRWIREHFPNAPSELRPGLTVEEITSRVLRLPFVLPEEVYELYRWADGSAGLRPVTIVPGYAFLSLEEAVELCQLNRELHWRNKRWMPLFDLNGEVTLYAASAATPAATAPVGVFEMETGSRRHTPSLGALLARTRQRYESGRYVERDGRIWDRKHLARLGLV